MDKLQKAFGLSILGMSDIHTMIVQQDRYELAIHLVDTGKLTVNEGVCLIHTGRIEPEKN